MPRWSQGTEPRPFGPAIASAAATLRWSHDHHHGPDRRLSGAICDPILRGSVQLGGHLWQNVGSTGRVGALACSAERLPRWCRMVGVGGSTPPKGEFRIYGPRAWWCAGSKRPHRGGCGRGKRVWRSSLSSISRSRCAGAARATAPGRRGPSGRRGCARCRCARPRWAGYRRICGRRHRARRRIRRG